MSTNTTFGTGNVISDSATNSLAAGEGNEIKNGNANMCLGARHTITNGVRCVCLGSQNTIDIKENTGFGNQCNGQANEIFSINNNPVSIANEVRGIGNTIQDGQAMDVCGFRNLITKGFNSSLEGQSCSLVSGALVHMEGFFNKVEGNPSNRITEDIIEIHVEGFDNKVVFVGDGRAGAHMTGQSGYFLFDKNKTKAEDTYNYSNQLAGGARTTTEASLNPGEGISMIDRTIINGVYPLGKHQSYLNTSDGLNYAIMMKSKIELKTGTFVTLQHDKCNKCDKTNKTSDDRVLVPAKNNEEVIGVITQAAGFIANAGQFAASERIQYDEYHYPIIKLNIATTENLKSLNEMKIQMKMELDNHLESEIREDEIKEGQLLSPAFLTVPLSNVDRSVPFVPFNERPNYYQVALLGSVIVNADFKKCDRHHLKCDVKDGIAVPGSKYWIVKFIDKHHLEILLK